MLKKARSNKKKGKAEAAPEPDAKQNAAKPLSGNERKKLERRLDEVTTAIAEAEERKAELAKIFSDPNFYRDTPRDDIQALDGEHGELDGKIAKWMEEWETLESRLGADASS